MVLQRVLVRRFVVILLFLLALALALAVWLIFLKDLSEGLTSAIFVR